MLFRINIHCLYDFINIPSGQNISFEASKDFCEPKNSFDISEDFNVLKSLNKSIHLFFDLQTEFEDQGYYSTNEPKLSNKNIDDDNYIVQTISRNYLELVTNYNGEFIVNLNHSTIPNRYDGVISKNNNEIIYVIGARTQNNSRIAKTGIFYKYNLQNNTTTSYYYPKFYNSTQQYNTLYFKNENTHKYSDVPFEDSQVFIDRGANISPNEAHELLQQLASVQQANDININVI